MTAVAHQIRQDDFSLLDMVEQPIVVLDNSSRVLHANQSADKLFGKQCEACLLSSMLALTDGSRFEISRQFLRRRQPLRCVFQRGRQKRYLDVYVKNFNASSDRAVYIVTFIDVTQFVKREKALIEEASIDSLTGILNRRRFLSLFDKELQRADRLDEQFSFLMFDVDHFKKINDAHGHAVGDEVLREIAKVVENELRDVDIFGRLGGEEFGVILPGTDIRQAQVVAERLRLAVKRNTMIADESNLNVTISIGIAPGNADMEKENVMRNADLALYSAKHGGRDRVDSHPVPNRNGPEVNIHF